MKIAILIPDRNDRPQLLANCLRMMKAQTLQPNVIEIVNDEPLSDACDITTRYRIGYDRLRNKGIDVIALIENDDYYAPNYLETMVNAWVKFGNPKLLGLNYTIYYHLKHRAWFTMYHDTRSSAMNTLIKPDMDFNWGIESDPYTDIHVWNLLGGVVFKPDMHICLGIKHGTGKCGGHMHTTRDHMYLKHGTADPDHLFLKEHMSAECFNFYSSYLK